MLIQNTKLLRTVLINAGLTLLIIGAWITASPEGFYAGSGIALEQNINLTNELRAPAGMLLGFGILLIAGAYKVTLRFTAAVSGCVIYLSYGFARLLSIAIDGTPGPGMIVAMGVEFAFGLACAFVLLKNGNSNTPKAKVSAIIQ